MKNLSNTLIEDAINNFEAEKITFIDLLVVIRAQEEAGLLFSTDMQPIILYFTEKAVGYEIDLDQAIRGIFGISGNSDGLKKFVKNMVDLAKPFAGVAKSNNPENISNDMAAMLGNSMQRDVDAGEFFLREGYPQVIHREDQLEEEFDFASYYANFTQEGLSW